MGQATDYTYYPNGLLNTVKDAKDQTTTYSYDGAGRLTGVLYADGKTDTFGYDAAGNMTSYAKIGVSGTIAYDELHRKTAETVNYGTFSKTFSYTYDASGNKQSFTTPEGAVYSYGYAKNNQPTSIIYHVGQDPAVEKQITFAYDRGRLAQTTFPGGITSDYGYNDASWLSGITTKTGAATLASSQYDFDNVGNITANTTEAGGHGYGYDPTYQVTSATHPALPAESFSYDAVGNRTMSGYSHDANNGMLTGGGATFGLDANGNTVTKTVGNAITTYGYNSADRLASVQLPGGTIATYTYDPFGRRIRKTVTPTQGEADVTYYLYSDEGLIGEYDAGGNLKKGYGWKPDGIWGTGPLFMTQNGSYYFYHNDHLGTPQKMTDEAGTIVWSATYSAFGKATVAAGSIENNLRFPGQYADAETNLHYNWNRYYDPGVGRYVEKDPIGFAAGEVNLHRYVQNNSLNISDPEGLIAPQLIGGAIGAIYGVYTAHNNGTSMVQGLLIGGLTGVLSTLPIPGVNMVVSGALMGGLSGGVSNIAGQRLDPCKKPFDFKALRNSVFAGALGGAVGGKMASFKVKQVYYGPLLSSAKARPLFTPYGQNVVSASVGGITAAWLDSLFQ